MQASIEINIEKALTFHRNKHDDNNEPVAFLDGSWYLPNAEKTGRQTFEQGPRIAGAQFFDIDDIAAKGVLNPKKLPHMMPPTKLFEAALEKMKITNQHTIIVYGQPQCAYVHRSWYQLWAMGFDLDKIFLLQGSLQDWKEAGGPIEEEPETVWKADDLDLKQPTSYKAKARGVVDFENMKELVQSTDPKKDIIVDVRARERFLGQVDEPRPGLRLGHMPGARNLPFMNLLEPSNLNLLKSPVELTALFDQAGLDWKDESRRIVTSCGSGATACTLAAALIKAGRDPNSIAIFDGSWIEWGGDPNTPITKEEDEDEVTGSATKKQKTGDSS